MLIFSCFLFRASNTTVNLIPDPIIPINITLVFLGNHKYVKESVLTQTILERWFNGLSHTLKHKESNDSPYFTTNEHSKYNAQKYRYTFSEVPLPDDVHNAFEDALSMLSRKSDFTKINGKQEKATIHPFSVEILIQSLIDYYQIPGYPFFIYASKDYHYRFCEGLHIHEIRNLFQNHNDSETYLNSAIPLDILNFTDSILPSLQIDLNRPWSNQIEDLIAVQQGDFLGGWQTSQEVSEQIMHHSILWDELRYSYGLSSCSSLWVGQNRFLWADVTNLIDELIEETKTIRYRQNTNYDHDFKFFQEHCLDLDSSESSIESQICDYIYKSLKNNQEFQSFLQSQPIKKYQKDINLDDMINNYDDQDKNQETQNDLFSFGIHFLTQLSAIIMDGIYSVITPETPGFMTVIPDNFIFSLTSIHEIFDSVDKIIELKNSKFNKTIHEFSKDLLSYVLPPAKGKIRDSDTFPISQWLNLGYFIYGDNEVDLSVLREELQEYDVPHHPEHEKDNTTSRRVVNMFLLHQGFTKLYSHAYDYISLSFSSPDSFDKLPGLRSSLIHMYGLLPYDNWHSLSILCPNSHHSQLNQIAKDVAYRNSLKTELSAAYIKLRKQLLKLDESVNYIETKTQNTLNISKNQYQIFQDTKAVSEKIADVLYRAERFDFENAYNILREIKKKRKSLGRMVKSMTRKVQDQTCQLTPSSSIQKPENWMDRIDKFAIHSFFIWISIFGFSLIVFLTASIRHIKQN